MAAGFEAALVSLGFHEEALFVAVCFEGYLRSGEAITMKWKDVVPPAPRLSAALRHWSLRLCPLADEKPTKAGLYDDTVCFDLEHHEFRGKELGCRLESGDREGMAFGLYRRLVVEHAKP